MSPVEIDERARSFAMLQMELRRGDQMNIHIANLNNIN